LNIGNWLLRDQLSEVVVQLWVESDSLLCVLHETSFFDPKAVIPGTGAHFGARNAHVAQFREHKWIVKQRARDDSAEHDPANRRSWKPNVFMRILAMRANISNWRADASRIFGHPNLAGLGRKIKQRNTGLAFVSSPTRHCDESHAD
jgi:hypothetical protein